MSSLEKR